MSSSKALWLQNAVLRMASKDENGLDLSRASKRKASSFWKLNEGLAQAGQQVVLMGTAAEADLLVARAVGPEGFVRIIERDPAQVQSALERLGPLGVERGQSNWSLHQAALDDLRTNLAPLADLLAVKPVQDLEGFRQLQEAIEKQRSEAPLVADDSVDVVVMTALNHLPLARMRAALAESYRVLRRGGRLVLTVFLADEPLPSQPISFKEVTLQHVPLETEIFALVAEARYYGMNVAWRADIPAKVVSGVEVRAFVIEAYKGKEGVCLDVGHAVIYRGPWSEVRDDDGHRYVRGERVAVCEKTYQILQRAPYAGSFIGVPCYLDVPADQAPLFDCNTPQLRDPKVTKGVVSVFDARTSGSDCCSPSSGSDCCSPSGGSGCC